MKRVIAVISGKGGVGKSTLAVNVATLLSLRGASTLLIDSDFYNPCTFFHLGLTPLPVGLQELLENKAQVADVLSIHPLSGLRCISASLHFYRNVGSKNLQKIIDSLDYEFIVIDCSPGLAKFIEDVIHCSNELFILMTPDIPSTTAVMKLLTIIEDKEKIGNMHLVLNRVANEPYEMHPHEIENLCFNTTKSSRCKISALIPEDGNVPRSIAAKTPIVISAPSSPAARVFRQFADKLLAVSHIQGRNTIGLDYMKFRLPQNDGLVSKITYFFRRLFG